MAAISRGISIAVAACLALASTVTAGSFRSVVVDLTAVDNKGLAKRLMAADVITSISIVGDDIGEDVFVARNVMLASSFSRLSEIIRPNGDIHVVGVTWTVGNDPLIRHLAANAKLRVIGIHTLREGRSFCGDLIRGATRCGIPTGFNASRSLKDASDAIRAIREEDFSAGLR